MHTLFRRSSSVSALLRYGGALRQDAAAPLSSSYSHSVGENDTKARGYSFLSSEKSNTINQLNLKRELSLGKRYESTATEDLDLGDKHVDEKEKEMKQEFGQTIDWIKKRLGDKVASVRISNRLGSSPCALGLGSENFGWSANVEIWEFLTSRRLSEINNPDHPVSRMVFEINPGHPIVRNLQAACKTNPDDQEALRAIDFLYSEAQASIGVMIKTGDKAGELKMGRKIKKLQIQELKRIVRLKNAEADMFQLKANEAKREAEGLQRIALAMSDKSEEEYLKQKLSEAEAEKQYLYEKIKLQESSRIS